MAKYRIGLGVSGGIAAYKAVEVLRLLQKADCDVKVAMTRHAVQFVQPLTFKALSDNHVIIDDYDDANPDPIAHVNYSQSNDLLLIVPATANIIGKFANGIADDFLSSTFMACTAPVLIAPAMNTTMWEKPATRRNVEQLKKDGVHFVEPVAGELACKTIGTGKLEDVENIVEQALELLETHPKSRATVVMHLSDDLLGEKILITVGGTREAIDPVRFISNHSSGKMGFAVAEAALARGAEVTVVAGYTTVDPPQGVKLIKAVTAAQMHAAVVKQLSSATMFVGAAAVADYAPANAAAAKIKKDGQSTMTLELTRTPDILAEVSQNRPKDMLVIGFAAETNNVVDNARAKMAGKNLDLVVANDITKDGAGFDTDTNIATILTRSGGLIKLPLMPKREMADRVLDSIVRLRRSK